MKNFKHLRSFILIIFSHLFVFVSFSIPQQGWFSVSAGYQYGHQAVFFVSADTGYVTTEIGGILITPDGGKKWMEIFLNNNYHPTDLFFLNSSIGWMSADNMRIFKTLDGGRSWKLCIDNTNYDYMCSLQSVHFVNENVGYAVGWKYNLNNFSTSTIIIKTSNGGLDWAYQTAGSQDFELYSVYFINENTGWIVGEKGYIFKTTNDGTSWIAQNSNTFAALISAHFHNDMIGWAAGSGGVILKTIDGGKNWILQNSPTFESLVSVFFLNENIGYACGLNGTILKTIDGGTHWDQQVSGTTQGLGDLHFVSPDTGYVVGWFGTILKTVNGGVGTNAVNNSEQYFPNTMRLEQNYPNPFNPETKIKYALPTVVRVKIVVYNLMGQKIRILADEQQNAGYHNVVWDGRNDSGNHVTSGVYLVRMEADNFIAVRKMILVR